MFSAIFYYYHFEDTDADANADAWGLEDGSGVWGTEAGGEWGLE
jgi:hypothetical protein